LDLGPFLVVIPGDQLHSVKRAGGVVQASDLGESVQPGLATLLSADAVFGPGGQGVIEALEHRAKSMKAGMGLPGCVESAQVGLPIARAARPPAIAATRHVVGEAGAITEDIY